MPTLTVSIVLFNNDLFEVKTLLIDLVSSHKSLKIYIIDNSSKNQSIFFRDFENVEYVFNNKNLGFAKGHNIGIKKAISIKSKYHLIINPDVRLNSDVLKELYYFMEGNKEVGMCIPKVLYPSGKLQYLCRQIPSPKTFLIRRFIPIKELKRKVNVKYELRSFGYNRDIEIPFVSGCFMFVRTNILEKVNGFDERFFLYFEDLDLSRRINAITKTVFYAKTLIYHQYNREHLRNLKVLIHVIISSIKYFNKWGWVFDKERIDINKRTLLQIKN